MEKRQRIVKKGWFRSLKWWQKIIYVDWCISFCLLCMIEDPMWAIFVNVANFAISSILLNKFVPVPED